MMTETVSRRSLWFCLIAIQVIHTVDENVTLPMLDFLDRYCLLSENVNSRAWYACWTPPSMRHSSSGTRSIVLIRTKTASSPSVR
jgi:hypothetical protein